MNYDEFMREFVFRLKKYFDTRQDVLQCFCKHGAQVEGWVKGEMLYLLDSGVAINREVKFDREVSIGLGRKKVDFALTIENDDDSERLWIEIKHWLIGYQKGTRWNASTYFADASSVGIKPDVKKLIDIPKGRKFLLILATANPGENDWSSGIKKFNSKFQPLYVKSLTNPNNFPPFYFLGLLSAYT